MRVRCNLDGAEQLYSIANVADALNRPRQHLDGRLDKGPPAAFYTVSTEGGRVQPFWTIKGIEQWRTFFEEFDHKADEPAQVPATAFSDHKAVNVVAGLHVTWRLWWKPAVDDGVVWWLSTPFGWYRSGDGGINWVNTHQDVRPPGRYFPAAKGRMDGAVGIARRGAHALQRRLEKGMEKNESDCGL